MTCGIYKIENKLNGKVYIGQSIFIEDRWKNHKIIGKNKNYIFHYKPLYQDMYNYGLDNFEFSIIEKCLKENLNDREVYWIKYYNSYQPNGYNLTYGGGNGHIHNYDDIYQEWLKGKLCQDLEQEFNCTDITIHKALLYNGVTIEEIFHHSNIKEMQPIVALTTEQKNPVKSFISEYSASKILGFNYVTPALIGALKNKKIAYGFYWEYLTENNIPKKEIEDKKFLEIINNFKKNLSFEQKERKSLSLRRVERPNREEFKKMIRIMPFTQIGNKYNVSDNAIRKWCDFYNLPRRRKDIEKISDEDWELI